METQTTALMRARGMLETHGRFPGGALPPDIADSWLRSLEHGLDPAGRPEAMVLLPTAFEQARERSRDLIRFARPELELLYDQIAGSNFMIALGSPEGLVLETLSDSQFQQSEASRAVIAGSIWTEAVGGTNGMGLCAATGRAAQVYGGEHFFRTHGNIACISAPIFDGRGGMAGILDASSGITVRQQHTAALVQMSAANIENGLIRHHHDNRLVLQFHPRPEYLGTLSSGMLVLDEDFSVHAINRRGALFLTGLPTLIGRGFPEIFDARFEDLACRLVRGETLRVRDRFGSAVSMRCVANRAAFALAGRHGAAAPMAPARSQTERNLFKDVVVEDPDLWRQLAALPEAVARRVPISIMGETGTGKEMVARLAHAAAGKDRPFVAYDARLATEEDFARVMFGSGPGEPGLLARASGGTLYLDEVTELPPRAQAALARVLDTGEYRRSGSSETVRCDVHVVSSSCHPFDTAQSEGRFRADLRHRLAGYAINLPPLRRRSDIAPLARRLIAAANPELRLDDDALAIIAGHDWPGNLHELRARMSQAALLARGPTIGRDDLSDLAVANSFDGKDLHKACAGCSGTAWKEQQCRGIQLEVERSQGNIAETARRLGVSRTTIYKHLGR
ncbi:sigma-54-dependent Fis family transcriptional regulator [Limimaricola soesokkakensis]|uniref:sigma-54-dependent Fis family transcriptional regulator n=1 Tax=Limimaricola soesokkakensis TaxID=1343159 RepID=UPI0035181C5D